MRGFTPLEVAFNGANNTMEKGVGQQFKRKLSAKNFSTKFFAPRLLTGFTFVELLLVIGIIIVISAFTLSLGINFYKSVVLTEAGDDILSVLRRTRNQAISQKNDSSFGTKFLGNFYTIFQGSSYASRIVNEDEIFSLPPGISVSGTDEVVFMKSSGKPTVSGLVILTSGNDLYQISINSEGTIQKE